jgi:ABC-2 type transport system permease protein
MLRELRARRKAFVVSTVIILMVVSAGVVAFGLAWANNPGAPGGGLTREEGNLVVASFATIVLFGTILGYGQVTLSGVVEEKASRVIEVVLGAVRPHHLLAGKALGIGLLGLAQVGMVGVTVVSLAALVGSLELPPATGQAMLISALWFVLGYAFYSAAYAAAGSLVARPLEASNAAGPINLLVSIGWIVAWVSLSVGEGETLALRVASLLPPLAPLTMPMRMVQGNATLWETSISIGLMAAGIYALIRLAGRIYLGAVLRGGAKTKWREAWRLAER